MSMEFPYLETIPWLEPREIPAINEDDVVAPLPLDELFMRLPNLEGDELGLLPREVPGPIRRLQPELVFTSLPSHWPIYENMDYLSVQEENRELWDAQQDEEEEQEAEFEEEILIANAVSRQGPVQVDPSTKHQMPMDNDKQLMKNIFSSSAEPHIATIGIQEMPMPDATPPVFVVTLERAELQQLQRQ